MSSPNARLVPRYKPFPFIFPAAIFTANPVRKQLFHIGSEFLEVCRAAVRGDWQHCAIECCDLIHSTETLLRILEDRKAVVLERAGRQTEMKNRARGYYGKD